MCLNIRSSSRERTSRKQIPLRNSASQVRLRETFTQNSLICGILLKKVLPFKEIHCLTVQLCVTHICKHEMLICKERKLMLNEQTIGKIRTISFFSQSQLPLSNSILTRLTSLWIMFSRIEPNRDWLAQPNNIDKTRSATLLWIRSKISAVTSVWYGVSALRKLFLAIPSDMHEWNEAKSENNSFLRSRKHHRDFGDNWTNNKFK